MKLPSLLRAPFGPAELFPAVLSGTVFAIVPLAAFLSFSVQPLAGKLLLPVQGGAASTWLGTMLYFQSTLLLGYGWAVWLLRRPRGVQVAATAGLALAALAASRLGWIQASPWGGLGGVLLTLTVATLPAMVLLFSIAPLMHGWLRGQGRPVPYHLYAISNAGGLAAVLLYPLVIERRVGLSDQMFVWHGLLGVLAALTAAAGIAALRCAGAAPPAPEPAAEPIGFRRIATWVGLSAATCLGMLGATHHLAAEIGSGPPAWVGPFGAYLLSYLVVFSGIWQPRFNLVSLGWLAISLSGFMLTKGVSDATVNGPTALWLLSLTAAGSFFGNGLLHESRPRERFDLFYLSAAAGGVAGGLLATFAAPVLFLRPSEFLAVSCGLLMLGLVRLVDRRQVLVVAVALVIVAAPVIGLDWQQTRRDEAGALRVRRFRNLYGCSLLRYEEGGLVLFNETTSHGSQLTASAASRTRPTLYYTESSGVGRVIEELQKSRPAIAVGVIGLGAGTLAAYARPADTMTFWDIDPKAIRIARDFFTFVPDSPGKKILLERRDGRKGLEASRDDFDLIVVDAFTGDGVPPHLLTREAFAAYFARLEKRDGILAIHATNRYANFFPIVGATAHSLGWSSLRVGTRIEHTTQTRDWDCTETRYLLVFRPGRLAQVASWLPAREDDGRVTRTLTAYEPLPPGDAIVWTDDRHADLDALDFVRYLTEP